VTFWQQKPATAVLILADGTRLEGHGIGAEGHSAGEVCFNTAMTGYQEVLTDPSYAGQIITFTFPHIGNIGANDEDQEDLTPAARHGAVGAIFKADVTSCAVGQLLGLAVPSNGGARLEAVDIQFRTLTGWEPARNKVTAYDTVKVPDDTLGVRVHGYATSGGQTVEDAVDWRPRALLDLGFSCDPAE